jgi:flagellar protein FlaG
MIKDPINSNSLPATVIRSARGEVAPVSVRKPVAEGGQALPQEETQSTEVIKLSQAVERINNRVQSVRRDLEFSVDEASKRTVIRVMDSQTKEVIRQIPAETVLAMARMIQLDEVDAIKGLLLEQEA